MTIREILKMGDPRLLRVAPPVPADAIGTPALRALVDDLFETMHAVNGAGLAAPRGGCGMEPGPPPAPGRTGATPTFGRPPPQPLPGGRTAGVPGRTAG